MKILAKTEDGYFVEMVRSELDYLTGYYYNHHKYKVGEQLKVYELYRQLDNLVDHEKEIKKMSHALKTAAGMLEKIDPIFHEVKDPK